MNRSKRTAVLAVGLLVLTAVLARSQDMGFATAPPGTFTQSIGTAVAKVANEKAGIHLTLQSYASSTVFLPAVASGAPQFGAGTVTELFFGYDGSGYFVGRKYPQLRAVAVLFPLRNTIFVRKSSNIKKIADLKGRPMPDGYSSQKIVPEILDAIYATGGLTRAELKPVLVPNVNAGADAMTAGKADGFMYALGSAKIREADAAVGIRGLPLDATPENSAKIAKMLPGLYFRQEKPGSDNPGILEPLYAVAYDSVVFTSASVDENTVYKLTKAMYENPADLASTSVLFRLFDPKTMAKQIPVPFHPGAIRFYKEIGIWPGK